VSSRNSSFAPALSSSSLYELISSQVSTFAEYERNTERVLPVVILDGVPAPT
jgi:hypothetical protein